MGIRVLLLSVGTLVATSSSVQAQNPPTSFSMVTYYRCAQGDTARADSIFKEQFAPFLKSEQSAGRLTSFGWLSHVEGGEWRRALYVIGTALDKLADARQALVKMGQSPERAKAFEEFGRLCPSHDDYIWRSKSSSESGADPGRMRSPYAMATYYDCDSNETEADAVLAGALAPVLNQRVKAGAIDSWFWMEHLFGGVYRRLLVIDGKDEKSLLANWASLQDDLQKAAPDMARRLDQICHSHADYIWQNITTQQ
jgi:hypothetical protein